MQLNIKNEEAYRLAREIADRTGESLTDVVTRALRERLEREQARAREWSETKAERLRRLREVASRFDALPIRDEREPDEDVPLTSFGAAVCFPASKLSIMLSVCTVVVATPKSMTFPIATKSPRERNVMPRA